MPWAVPLMPCDIDVNGIACRFVKITTILGFPIFFMVCHLKASRERWAGFATGGEPSADIADIPSRLRRGSLRPCPQMPTVGGDGIVRMSAVCGVGRFPLSRWVPAA